jgi:DNA-binding NtrC family response regulator
MADKVLIVEDREEWRQLLCNVLVGAGYICTPVKDFITALKVLREQDPSALVLDLQLKESVSNSSEFQGWKLATEALKSKVPVVVVTGHASVPLANDAFREYKVVAFLEKIPFDRDRLLSAVADGVEESRLRQVSEDEADNAIARIRKLFRKGERIDKY